MTVPDLLTSLDPLAVGRQAHALAAELYPIGRSITGDGFRTSLDLLRRFIPIESTEIPTGTNVFDWTVPDEWNLRTAWIKNARGETIVDQAAHSLHVMSYSEPVRATLTLGELRPRLHTLMDRPDDIPYRTSYYNRSWGFCMRHRTLEALQDADGPFEVLIDSTLAPGHLTYGQCVLPGHSSDEVLLSCHSCHPSLANDNCSSMALVTLLAQLLAGASRRYTYRFLFAPGTIGAIAWLSRNVDHAARIRHGLVCACLGDPGPMTYKKSRRANTDIHRAVMQVLRDTGKPHSVEEFSPYGYDERQFCSPGFDLPVGCFMRTPPGRFPEYHTSADDMSFITPEALGDSMARLLEVVSVLESNRAYVNQKPHGEPRLGKRGLYNTTGGSGPADLQMAMLWVLNMSDGTRDLLDIASRSGMPFATLRHAAELLAKTDLLASPDLLASTDLLAEKR